MEEGRAGICQKEQTHFQSLRMRTLEKKERQKFPEDEARSKRGREEKSEGNTDNGNEAE